MTTSTDILAPTNDTPSPEYVALGITPATWTCVATFTKRDARLPEGGQPVSYSTTISVPVAGGHLYVRGIPEEANSDCAICSAFPWDPIHGSTFASQPIADDDCLYRMEASDDNGRNWASNGLRWATQELAEDWTRDLSLRWFGCSNLRIVRESDGEVVKVIL